MPHQQTLPSACKTLGIPLNQRTAIFACKRLTSIDAPNEITKYTKAAKIYISTKRPSR